jgi:hypothetical protein
MSCLVPSVEQGKGGFGEQVGGGAGVCCQQTVQAGMLCWRRLQVQQVQGVQRRCSSHHLQDNMNQHRVEVSPAVISYVSLT